MPSVGLKPHDWPKTAAVSFRGSSADGLPEGSLELIDACIEEAPQAGSRAEAEIELAEVRISDDLQFGSLALADRFVGDLRWSEGRHLPRMQVYGEEPVGIPA
jgi:hypothetical protein